jgi:DNA-directed RNA polymerase specialized sigma24 family protein
MRKEGCMTNSAQARFMAILPRLRLIIARYFRSYYNQTDKDDAIAEAVAMAWRKFAALIQRGIDPEGLISSLGQRCALNVHRGAKLTTTRSWRGRSIREPLCPVAKRKYGLRGRALWEGCLATLQPVPDAVAFRMDFESWRRWWPKRDLAIIDARLAGYTCMEIAQMMGTTRFAINQRLPLFHQSWQQFGRVS